MHSRLEGSASKGTVQIKRKAWACKPDTCENQKPQEEQLALAQAENPNKRVDKSTWFRKLPCLEGVRNPRKERSGWVLKPQTLKGVAVATTQTSEKLKGVGGCGMQKPKRSVWVPNGAKPSLNGGGRCETQNPLRNRKP